MRGTGLNAKSLAAAGPGECTTSCLTEHEAFRLEAKLIYRKIFVGKPAPASSSLDHTEMQDVETINLACHKDSPGNKRSSETPETVAGQHAVQQITERTREVNPWHPEKAVPLPGFIKSLHTSTEACFRFLLAEGALTLPSLPLQQALVKSYIEYAYPRMPVLDLGRLCDTLDSKGEGNCQISLLLYQAILWAGSSHVRACDLRGTGYANKRSLRDTLYRRIEVSTTD